MHFVGGRDPGNVLRNVPLVHRILREHDIDTIVSTGSAMALPFYALGRARGLELHYIESAARSDGPSKTASMIARIPGVNLYTQYPAWADEKWRFRGAVFDSFVAADEPRGDRRRDPQGRRLAGHVQGLRLRAPRQAAARDPSAGRGRALADR